MVVTRFAPSPTGALHIGSARTALFCWLWARNQQGKFILRIEDTDRERSTQEAVDGILAGLSWLGLHWDEGPFYQSQRFERYQQVAEQLLASGNAYKCYCSKERLEQLREQQQAAKEKPRYDGHCRQGYVPADAQAPYVVRFKTPQTGTIVFQDLVRGSIEFQNEELDDLIIVRSDGAPTYNFTVVVDDWDMGITHVLRGDDHINNTPRQIHILQALKAQVPEYGHMPMLLGPDGKKLSKRIGSASVLEFRDQGFLPQALLNYLVRLGWSHGDTELFSEAEMISLFDIHQINVAPSAINPEKLLWLNQHYLKTSDPQAVASHLAWHMEKMGIEVKQGPALKEIVVLLRERSKTLVEMAEKSRFFFEEVVLSEDLIQKHFASEASLEILKKLIQHLAGLAQWHKEAIHEVLNMLVEELGIKLGLIAQPVRVAVTGTTVSPSIDATLALLGQEKTLQRLKEALEQASTWAAQVKKHAPHLKG